MGSDDGCRDCCAAGGVCGEVGSVTDLQSIKTFKKAMYFFNWLENTINDCHVCGVPGRLTVSISLELPSQKNDWKGVHLWLCQYCAREIIE